MAELHYHFDVDKLVNALAYLATNPSVSDLTNLKAAKLLYLADRDHFFKFGRPIIGDSYVAMDLGPVPGATYNVLKSLDGRTEVDIETKNRVLDAIEIKKSFFQKYFRIFAKRKPNLDVFSDSDIESLNIVISEFGKTPANELVDLTHQHKAYKVADARRQKGSSVPLPYELFFEDAPSGSTARELAELGQEGRDFAAKLKSDARSAVLAHQR